MIQPIASFGLVIVGVERPAVIRNHDAKLPFDVTFSTQWREGEILTVRQIKKRPGGRNQGWGLVEIAVVAAEDPIQAGNFQSDAKSGVGRVLRNRGPKFRLPKSGNQGQPRRHAEFVVDELGGDASIYADGRCGEVWLAVREYVIEVVVLVLTESVDSGLQVVVPQSCVKGRLRPSVIGIFGDG